VRDEPVLSTLDNGVLRAEIGADGEVSSLVDLRDGRSLALEGFGGLRLFRDEPVRWDAWDLDRHVLRSPVPMTGPVTVETTGDGVVVTRRHGASAFTTTYAVRPGAARLEITVEVDWQESEHLLKLSLPVAVRTLRARYETQYGSIERPTHENTLADEAQYEVCSHRWVHVAEPGLGIGVANDSTYGCDVRRTAQGTEIRPTLLRAPRFPDPGTDRGRHTFRFAVVAGDETGTRAAADDLNAPLLDALGDVPPLVTLDLDAGAAVVDWVKLADDRGGDVIVRLHETLGGRATGRLRSSFEAAVTETDLLERSLPAGYELPVALRAGELVLGPYQIATLRLTPTGTE
jgi:alpha-mannosidase